MLIDVISVRVLPGYQLDLEFKNGVRRKFDMRPLLLMKPWNRVATPVLFERVRVDYGSNIKQQYLRHIAINRLVLRFA
jgi:hypothetical protein